MRWTRRIENGSPDWAWIQAKVDIDAMDEEDSGHASISPETMWPACQSLDTAHICVQSEATCIDPKARDKDWIAEKEIIP